VTGPERRQLLVPDVYSWPVATPMLWESLLERKRSGDLDPQWSASFKDRFSERYMLSPEELAALVASDICGYLADGLLHKVDSATMAHGLEARVPYLDHHLFEAVGGAAILGNIGTSSFSPVIELFGSRSSKERLRKIAGGLLPQESVVRKKQGFRVPLDEWVAHFARGEIGRTLTDRKRLQKQGWWNTDALIRIVDEYRSRSERSEVPPRQLTRSMWLFFAYQLWLETIPKGN
jgi:asparagine synthetase B (glutamine-hydrolysing)